MLFTPLLFSLLAFSVTAIPIEPTPSPINGSIETGKQSVDTDKPYERMRFYNWDYKDLNSAAFEDISHDARNPIGLANSTVCPDGWFKFSDSCYYFELDMLGFAKAEKRCFEKQATLFVANSDAEWDAVREHSPKGYFSWIGLIRFSQFEESEQLPRWQTEGGMNPNKLNWLIKPYQPITSGYSSLANCVTHYNPYISPQTGSYTFYYPCVSLFNSICERNATIINAN